MSDYCYSDRLLLGYEILSATHGFRVLPVTAIPSGCPFFLPEQDFRDELSFRHCCLFPEGYGISFKKYGDRSPSLSEAL